MDSYPALLSLIVSILFIDLIYFLFQYINLIFYMLKRCLFKCYIMHQIIFFNLYNLCTFLDHLITSIYNSMNIKNFKFLLNLKICFFIIHIIFYLLVKILCLFFIYFYLVEIFDFDCTYWFILFNLLLSNMIQHYYYHYQIYNLPLV